MAKRENDLKLVVREEVAKGFASVQMNYLMENLVGNELKKIFHDTIKEAVHDGLSMFLNFDYEMTTTTAAKIIGVDRTTINRWVKQGKFSKLPNGRISRNEVLRCIGDKTPLYTKHL